ncbi:DUF1877 family protein [Sphingomonas sp. Leaf343]|uniref:DUF1877 family protein n=1 Tax=Sphingomonas sp. Leaf343 TaxID=1736345 RepID=UPI000713F8EC|nr:DUF1877 family protein [Sphingomonas sp. Leaf343]KQR83232.1 hypothetical protein ASG07_09765 [Sphingomonas sp. Leaf343]
MVMYLRRATPEQLGRAALEPDVVESIVFPEEYSDSDSGLIDFDKAWNALHFILTGEVYGTGHPLGIIADETPFVRTGEIGSFEYSIVTPSRMAAFAAALSAVADEVLAARYDPQAMMAADVYLADVFLDGGSDALGYVMQGVPALREFAADCAAAGDGAIRVLA